MSEVTTGAERALIDLTHFVYSSGSIGKLKVLDTVPVIAGDSFQLDLVGAFRLSPFRRGLSVDCCVDVFTFYIPYRHVYGSEFVDLMKAGIPKTGLGAILSAESVKTGDPAIHPEQVTSFLGTHFNTTDNVLPKFYYQSYLRIFNHYFKNPYEADVATPLTSLDIPTLKDGFSCAHLESSWTKPLNPNVSTTSTFSDIPTNNGIDIIGLDAAYGKLHTQQERDNFMLRYRDVISGFGGSTTFDADQRPRLMMHDTFWGSGYDTDGTTQETLGQFSGRVQQPFSYQVPRFFVPEHGVIMTLMLPRFPATHFNEYHYFVGSGGLDYNKLACDPAIVGNSPPVSYNMNDQIQNASETYKYFMPHSQWYRYHPSFVDFRYRELQGFPFATIIPTDDNTHTKVVHTQYDQCFQTTQLGHWNVQTKFNCSVLRRIPNARDSIMTT